MSDKFLIPDEFPNLVRQEVENINDEYPHNNMSNAFMHWAIQYILPELDSDEIFSSIFVTDKDNELSVHFSYIDEQKGIQYLFGVIYPTTLDIIKTEELAPFYKYYNQLQVNNTVNESNDLASIVASLEESLKHDFEIQFGVIVFGSIEKDSEDELNSVKDQNATFTIYDINTLYELHFAASGVRYQIDDIVLELPLFGSDSSILELTDINPYSVVANVDLLEYARRVEPYLPRIYDANVRHPLVNEVNKGIRNTIYDETDDRKYFWHYNNGLTILVQDIQKVGNSLVINGPTIVNGCQTTNTISASVKDLGDAANAINLWAFAYLFSILIERNYRI